MKVCLITLFQSDERLGRNLVLETHEGACKNRLHPVMFRDTKKRTPGNLRT